MLKQFSKAERGWIMYDWANSAFSAIISATLLPIFFSVMATGAGMADNHALAMWGYATSLATFISALLAPILGSLGDFPGYKKKMFVFFVAVGVIGTGILGFTGSWQAVFVFYLVASVGYNGANLFYDSFLNDVTTEERMDKVSTYGYSLGYIGGSTIPLVIAFLLLLFGEKIGVSQVMAMRIAFVMTAVWWAVFTWPMLRDVHQIHSVPRAPGRSLFGQSFGRIASTFKEIVRHKGVLFFLIAYFFYIDGVGTIIHMATIFGTAKGIDSTMMVLVLVVVQLVAFPCAIAYGVLAKRFSTRTMILVGIVTYLLVCVVGVQLQTLAHFILLGALVGTAQGGLQALSRSYFGKIIPNERASEFFGFFDIFGRFSAVLGPFLFGLVVAASGNKPENGVFVVLAMFLIGGAVFLFLVPKAQQQIKQAGTEK